MSGNTDAEVQALDQIIDALISEQIVSVSSKAFINATEDLVFLESCNQLTAADNSRLDIRDVGAYALNRPPPLYATTSVGTQFQRRYALQDLKAAIQKEVKAAIEKLIQRPEGYVDRISLPLSNT